MQMFYEDPIQYDVVEEVPMGSDDRREVHDKARHLAEEYGGAVDFLGIRSAEEGEKARFGIVKDDVPGADLGRDPLTHLGFK